MAKRVPKAANQVRGSPSVSGATGGPSTGHGMNYQIDYAVYRALDVISRSLCAPHKQWTIRIEPRAVSKEALTRWDLAIAPPEELIEAKLNPTRQDILDWLDRVRQGRGASPERAFSLVYGKGGGPLLRLLGSLRRLAIEASQDAQTFQQLLEREGLNDAHQILVPLGEGAHTALQRMTLEQIPEELLARHIQLQARMLAGEQQGKRLIDLLFHKFSEAVPQRITFFVSDLCQEIECAGIPLHSPPDINPSDLCPHAAATLLILQVCPTGLPGEVIARAVCAESSDLERELTSLVTAGVLVVEDGLWSVKPLPRELTRPDIADLLCRTLEALLGFIECYKHDTTARDQLQNAIALTRKCAEVRPKSVAAVFITLDKLLKNWGDKHLVLDIADLCIGAARCAPRTRREVEGEAQALICGRSWVFQRIGRLTEALIEAEKSLQLGEDIGWERNTVYCKKCIGRLYRMMAEQEHDMQKRAAWLTQSVACIQEAIQRFTHMPEFGALHPEVGDCYSLLGRTYLVANRAQEAYNAVREAYRLITDDRSKDYLDLVILHADWEATWGDKTAAEGYYEQALALARSDHPEISEMRARIYYQRGRNREALRKQPAAMQDFHTAAEIWRALGEHTAADEAQWHEIRLGDDLPQNTLQRLEREQATVRIRAVAFHKQRLAAIAGPRRPRREAPSREYWEQLIKDAKQQSALEVVEW